MTTVIDPQDPVQIDFVVELLEARRPVGLPTETVYGLAALASDETALARIFELKARPHFDPLIIHVLDLAGASLWIEGLGDIERKLCERFWPGPLTILFKKSSRIPDLCTAGSEWVAVRSPAHPAFRRVLERLHGIPLAAPSANRFASISPTSAQDVVAELGPYGLDAVVDGGPCEHGLESTVLKVHSDREVEVVRPGALSLEALKEALGASVEVRVRASGSGALPEGGGHEAPGQHHIHYAPKKALYLVQAEKIDAFVRERALDARRGALLEVFEGRENSEFRRRCARKKCLSPSGQWGEAAAQLFSAMRWLDSKNDIDYIIALECSQESLGLAISDRLRRASAKTP